MVPALNQMEDVFLMKLIRMLDIKKKKPWFTSHNNIIKEIDTVLIWVKYSNLCCTLQQLNHINNIYKNKYIYIYMNSATTTSIWKATKHPFREITSKEQIFRKRIQLNRGGRRTTWAVTIHVLLSKITIHIRKEANSSYNFQDTLKGLYYPECRIQEKLSSITAVWNTSFTCKANNMPCENYL